MLDQLKLMPYNQKQDGFIGKVVDVSTDRGSDLPFEGWEIPATMTKVHVFRIGKMWIDWAR